MGTNLASVPVLLPRYPSITLLVLGIALGLEICSGASNDVLVLPSQSISHFLPPHPPSQGSLSPAVSFPPFPGELRAHLVPCKASRGEGAGRPSSQPNRDPLPPPLPKKQLQRAESLPEQGPSQHHRGDNPTSWASSILYSIPPHEEGAPSSIPPWDRPSWGPKKPLAKSQSLGESVAWSSVQKVPLPSLAELTFGTADRELGQLLESPAGVCGVVLGCQVAALARLSARIQEELIGPEEQQQLLEAELAGKSWAALSILDREPCCESRDAWYFRVGFAFEQTQLVVAAKVRRELGKIPRVVQREVASCSTGGCGATGKHELGALTFPLTPPLSHRHFPFLHLLLHLLNETALLATAPTGPKDTSRQMAPQGELPWQVVLRGQQTQNRGWSRAGSSGSAG